MKKVLVLDFGGQYNLLVARRVRECGVYCEIKPYTMSMDDIRAFGPAAIIFTGGPATVFEPNAPALDNAIFELGLPILGICYGQQLMIHQLGGACRRAEVREYGKVELTHDGTSLLFDGVEPTSICWMSHGVEVERLSPGFRAIAHTVGCAYAAIENAERKLYGVQFHPEVLQGTHLLFFFSWLLLLKHSRHCSEYLITHDSHVNQKHTSQQQKGIPSDFRRSFHGKPFQPLHFKLLHIMGQHTEECHAVISPDAPD